MTYETQPQWPSGAMDALRVYLVDALGIPVLNISQVGMAVQSEKPFTIGSLYTFRLECEGLKVLLDGKVVRCQLAELAESTSGERFPLYQTGVEFHLQRNPKEVGLLSIIRANLYGEKRLGSTRIVPRKKLTADVGRSCFPKVLDLSDGGIRVESQELLDMDEEWPLVIQLGEKSVDVNCRIVHASKKSQTAVYDLQLEFVNAASDVTALLGLLRGQSVGGEAAVPSGRG